MFRYPFDNLESNTSFTLCAILDKPYHLRLCGRRRRVLGQRYNSATIRTLIVLAQSNHRQKWRLWVPPEKVFEERGGSLRELSDQFAFGTLSQWGAMLQRQFDSSFSRNAANRVQIVSKTDSPSRAASKGMLPPPDVGSRTLPVSTDSGKMLIRTGVSVRLVQGFLPLSCRLILAWVSSGSPWMPRSCKKLFSSAFGSRRLPSIAARLATKRSAGPPDVQAIQGRLDRGTAFPLALSAQCRRLAASLQLVSVCSWRCQ